MSILLTSATGFVGLQASPEQRGPIRIGVSACIVGQRVRFNGGHKLSHFVRDVLGAQVEFVPVCPEVEMGLGVPRETLRLVKRTTDAKPILLAPRSGTDHTAQMEAYAAVKAEELARLDLCGFIVHGGSPSCGMERVRAYSEGSGMPERSERGLFTRELMRRMPQLPIEEDGRLCDPFLREHFVERVFAHRRLKDLFCDRWTPADLAGFHVRETLLVLAHSDYQPLSRLVARRTDYAHEEWGLEYQKLFLDALSRPATVKRHVNVLQHVAGYFRRGLDAASRAEVADLIEAYRKRLVPLIVPLTLIKHHARALKLRYLNVQTYLHGQPRKLLPQNHLGQ